ncbi:MAG: tol-pal system protein YbgF, partial [Methylocystis sp.]
MFPRYALIFALPLLMAGAAQAFDVYGDPRPEGDLRHAQTHNVPPSDLYEGPEAGPGSDAAAAMRIDRLERELRRLTGQNEELQHRVQLLEEQLRAAKPEPHSEAAPHGPTAPPAVASTAPETSANAGKRGDAFDPATQPTAPGAPRPLGTTTPSAPLESAARPTGSVTIAPVREAGQPL